jgi:hypothetical protein
MTTGAFLTCAADIRFTAGRCGRAELRSWVNYQDANGIIHTAHPGLITDGRSGRIGYYVIGTPYNEDTLLPALVHDWYCAKIKLQPPSNMRNRLREAADDLFAECLRASGETWRVPLMHRAVRLHAWAHRNDAAAHWTEDFASEEASLTGTLDGLLQ